MNSTVFNQFLNQLSKQSLPVIDTAISLEKYIPIDISENNIELQKFNIKSSKEWTVFIDSYLKMHNKNIAFGGYLEKRNLYDRSDYFKNTTENNKRNIHLGIDLWCKENTKVLAVLDGEIHSFNFNNNYGDYGPTIIIKHKIKSEFFYSLYGHLTLASIKNRTKGEPVFKGDIIGLIGDASINGDYAPHLHFQIIRDLEGNIGDYPGVSSEENIDYYKNNCPNPNLLLKLPVLP